MATVTLEERGTNLENKIDALPMCPANANQARA